MDINNNPNLLIPMMLLMLVGAVGSQGVPSNQRCNREPPGISSPKTPGDNGYRIMISGNPEKYVPGEAYTVTLKGWRTQLSIQKFMAFMLLVEPSNSGKEISSNTVGTFQLFEDTMSKFSPECPNAVQQTSLVPKPEVQVRWIAPQATSGCVRFKALVVEQKDTWFMDDGGLTKELCEEEQENLDEQPDVLDECCACDEAKYEVVFEGLWNRHTHPKDFPTNEWLTHFSDIIGASHNPEYAMWEYGGIASEGLRQVAEWGSTRTMETELKAQSEHIRTIIKSRGLWYPNVNGKTFAVFRVDRRHHLMSLVSMLGPSPDWIVGVSRLELCLSNCSWAAHKVFNLYPWDAGTDSGVTYTAPNSPTYPRDKIRQVTSSYPNNEKSPFYDLSGEPMKPVARLTITRQRLYEKACGDGLSDPDPFVDLEAELGADGEDHRPECSVTDWASFTACSATCGKGLRSRSRSYLMPMKAQMADCKRINVQREMCASNIPVCDDNSGELVFPNVVDARCATTDWADWSDCSATCGKGLRVRTRRYLDPMGQKICASQTRDTEMCMADLLECGTSADQEPRCATTIWSDWSPCSVTCGKGSKVRTRQWLDADAALLFGCQLETIQQVPCMSARTDCHIDPAEAKEVCMMERNVGPCRGYFPRWYYDISKGMCLQFIYGGCRGNRNNFERYEDCNRMCEALKGEADNSNYAPGAQSGDSSLAVVDCMVSEWFEWTSCSATCGKGRMERRRMIKVHSQNGGKECPKKLVQRKKCTARPCGE